MLNYYRYSPFYFCPQDKASTSEVTKVKQAEVTNWEDSDFNKVKQVDLTKVKQAEVTNWDDSDFNKVKQAEVTNGHKLLFCKMNKMSHCCVELLQVFTLLFLSTGQGFHFGGHQGQAGGGNQLGGFGQVFFDVSVPPPPIYSGSHLQQAAPQGSAHGKYVFICNEVSRIRNSMFCFAHCPFNNCLMFSFELTGGGGVLQSQPTNVQARGRDQKTKRTRPSSNYHDKT